MTSTFEELQAKTYCPFAKGAKIVFAPEWEHGVAWDNNVKRHADALLDFTRTGMAERAHGFVAEIGIGKDAMNFESVRRAFGTYLLSLAEHDLDCCKQMRKDKLAKDWQFQFGGMPIFLNVFGPCYKPPHSKYLKSDSSFWVFFQPDYSFDLCNINQSKIKTKYAIRAAFADHSMQYNGSLIDQRIESLLYMFPQDMRDEPIRWWQD